MIYTCTTNPSLDYYISLPTLTMGKTHRSDFELYGAGGKGVNVSIVLNNFQIPSMSLGFLGGFTKDYYLKFIHNYPFIQPLFTLIEDNTRINVKVMNHDCETSINAKGPKIKPEEFAKFKYRLNNIYDGDIFVLSGNIEQEIAQEIIELIHDLCDNGIKVVIDSDPQILNKCLDCKLFMAKLNRHYLNFMDEDLSTIASKMVSGNIEHVLYSSLNEPSFLYTKDLVLTSPNLKDSLINTTGQADCMVAGYLYGYIRGGDEMDCFRYANASGVVTTLSNEPDSKERLEAYYSQVKVDVR